MGGVFANRWCKCSSTNMTRYRWGSLLPFPVCNFSGRVPIIHYIYLYIYVKKRVCLPVLCIFPHSWNYLEQIWDAGRGPPPPERCHTFRNPSLFKNAMYRRRSISRTDPCTSDLDCVIMEMLTVHWTIVACWIPNNNEIRPTGEVGFGKIALWRINSSVPNKNKISSTVQALARDTHTYLHTDRWHSHSWYMKASKCKEISIEFSTVTGFPHTAYMRTEFPPPPQCFVSS
jgi:hypothetical protein